MMKINFLRMTGYILFFLFCFQFVQGQSVGDYRSNATGLWNSSSTWSVYDGSTWVPLTSGYPGVSTVPAGSTTSTVTILGCHEITVNSGTNNNFTYQYIRKLIINGRMKLLKNNNVRFGNALQEVLIDGGSIYWSDNPVDLYLPQNCLLTMINLGSTSCSFSPSGNGLQPIGDCNAALRLYIGEVVYSSCNGGANPVGGSFGDVNTAGGAYFAALPLASPPAVCLNDNKPITLSASVIKYIAGDLGTLTYLWEIVTPIPTGYAFTSSTAQSVDLGTLTIPGDYKFKLTVTATINGGVVRSNEFFISVEGVSTFNGSTWSNGIPSSGNHRHAIIDGDYNTSLQGSFDACSCTINTGKKLTIAEGNYVKVVDYFKNLGIVDNVVIESDGNLVQVKDGIMNSGNITSKSDIQVGAARNQYNYLGTPVNFATGESFKTIYPGTTFVLYHNETNNFFYNSSGVNIPGRGLAVKEPTGSGAATVTATYKGVPQNGIINIGVTNKNINVTTFGYNLLGNPYPSNIDLLKLYDINGGKTGDFQLESPHISATFYFWNNNGNTIFQQQGSGYGGQAYAIFNVLTGPTGTGTQSQLSSKVPSNLVKVGQGFMTRSLETNYNFLFNNSIRTKDIPAVDFLGKENTDVQVDRYWLQMTAPSGITSTIAVVHYASGNDFFGPEDSRMMGGSDALYSISEGEKLAIDGRSSFQNTMVIPLGIQSFANGNYTLGVDVSEGIFANGQSIYLKDTQTGIITNLSEGSHTFAATAGESTGRFEILYQPETVLATAGSVKEEVMVYRDGNEFVVRSASKKITVLEVYDGSGRMVYGSKPHQTETRIDASIMTNGIYLVKIDQGGAITTKKILK